MQSCKVRGRVAKTASVNVSQYIQVYSGADKSLARPGRKQTTATEGSEFYISYL